MNISILHLCAPEQTVRFVRARRGNLIYHHCEGFDFQIPIAEMGDAEFRATEKAITLMRWIRAAIKDRTMELGPGDRHGAFRND